MKLNKTKASIVAVLTAVMMFLSLQEANGAVVYNNGTTKTWNNPFYTDYTYVSVWGGGDCNTVPGYVWYPGLYAGSRTSSVTIWPERQHCNYLSVRANTASHPYKSKCVNVNDNGIPFFSTPWDNNVDAVVVQWNSSCPLFW